MSNILTNNEKTSKTDIKNVPGEDLIISSPEHSSNDKSGDGMSVSTPVKEKGITYFPRGEVTNNEQTIINVN